MKYSKTKLGIFVIISIIAVLCTASLSILFGSTNISLNTILQAFINPDLNDAKQIAVIELRLPRTIGDILVGAALASSGAIMQAVTRNPLADSGLLGINAGASFALAICLSFFTGITFGFTVIASFIGALLSMVLVFGLLMIKQRKIDNVRLVLAGLAVSLFLTALSQGISILFNTGQDMTFWQAGGVAGIRMSQLKIAAPIIIFGLIAGILLSKQAAILSLGEEAATGLGVNVQRVKLECLADVLILAGTSVALAGPIAFVGLLVPYIVRFFVGSSYQKVIPGSMLLGSLFMLAADIISRTINAPSETPIGLIFAIIGVPVFIYIARKGDKSFD